MAVVFAGVSFTVSQTRAARIQRAEQQVAVAETALEAVLERQASMVPALVTLAGGEAGALEGGVSALREAPSIVQKLDASEALSIRMATTLGGLPATVDQTTRLDLQHELTRTQNHITAHRQAYEAARVARDDATSGGCR